MSALIKVSNHLALILPGEPRRHFGSFGLLPLYPSAPTDTPEQVDFLHSSALFRITHITCQTARNRELTDVAFGDVSAPRFGPAMMLTAYCGKWIVGFGAARISFVTFTCSPSLLGVGDPLKRVAQGSGQ